MAGPISNETAGKLRALWFDYLDTIAPARPKLHGFCLKLTGSVWDAEDLLQDTLLRGFGAIGRGDLHGTHSAVRNPQAYLCRTAVNLWIDGRRRDTRALPSTESDASPGDAVITNAAGAALFARTAPQERAAVVLKDVFDFSLAEIADILSTTEGAVKAALHRGRGKLEGARAAPLASPASPELIDRFVAAFNARDVRAVTALLLESVTIDVAGVGGERGRDAIWISASMAYESVRTERRRVWGEWLVAHIAGNALAAVTRMEEAGGQVSRAISYVYCPETLAIVAADLGLAAVPQPYHQTSDVLARMIAGSVLPWRVTPEGE